MKPVTPLVLIMSFLFVIFACDKEDTPEKDSYLISFTKLETEKDSLKPGEVTKIHAIYEGKGVIFSWNASSGNLTGGGEEVNYLVAFCDIGLNTITCKAAAEDSSITRTIQIHVVP